MIYHSLTTTKKKNSYSCTICTLLYISKLNAQINYCSCISSSRCNFTFIIQHSTMIHFMRNINNLYTYYDHGPFFFARFPFQIPATDSANKFRSTGTFQTHGDEQQECRSAWSVTFTLTQTMISPSRPKLLPAF